MLAVTYWGLAGNKRIRYVVLYRDCIALFPTNPQSVETVNFKKSETLNPKSKTQNPKP